MDNLINDLLSGNDRQRRKASFQMGATADPKYVSFLIDAYNDSDWSVRRNVLESLHKIGTPEAMAFVDGKSTIEPTASVDEEKQFAYRAGLALGKITNDRFSSGHLPSEITYSPSRTNNYKSARLLASWLAVLSWLMLVLGISAIVGAISIQIEGGFGSEIQATLSFLAGIVMLPMAPIFALFSEMISVLLDTEANTRQTAKTLERILRSQTSSSEVNSEQGDL